MKRRKLPFYEKYIKDINYLYKHDRRRFKWIRQFKEKGWTDRDIWNIDTTLAKIIINFLKRYKEVNIGSPNITDRASYEDNITAWNKILDKIIHAFEIILSDDYCILHYNSKEYMDMKEGLELFAKYYNNLWW